jgi:hypothetical protein
MYIPTDVATAILLPDDDTDTLDADTDNINAVEKLDPYVDDTYTSDDVEVALLLVLVSTITYSPLLDIDTDTIDIDTDVDVDVLKDVLDHVLP